MTAKPKTPYVVTDPKVLERYRKELVGVTDAKLQDVIDLLRKNPGKPVAVPIDYFHPTNFSRYNKESTKDHVILRCVTDAENKLADVYYVFLKEGRSPHQGRKTREQRANQKRKRVEQTERKRPEEFPEPELVDEVETK
jgi:hypothetical protein